MKNNPKALRWLKEGKRRYANDGIRGINIKEMSKSLRVAKTSFYFHFNTKQEYLKHLYNYWIEDGSIRIINAISVIDDPHARFKKLFELALSNIENEKFLFQMRDYAQSCKYTASVLKKVENKRLKLLSNILIEMGYSKSLAMKTAKDIYIFTLGYYEFYKNNRITPKLVKETVNGMIILYNIK
jgi:AcrR family transcriptional regulator